MKMEAVGCCINFGSIAGFVISGLAALVFGFCLGLGFRLANWPWPR